MSDPLPPSALRRKLTRATFLVAGTGACGLVLVLYFIYAAHSAQTELGARLSDLDRRVAQAEAFARSNRIRLADTESFVLLCLRAATDQTGGGVLYELAQVTGQDPWSLPSQPEQTTRGQLAAEHNASLPIPVPALEDADTGLLDVHLLIRTDHQVLARTDAPVELSLICTGGMETPQRQGLAAHFFQVVQMNQDISTERRAANTCHFVWRPSARLSLELNAKDLAANLNRTGSCDLSFRLSHMLAIGSGGK